MRDFCELPRNYLSREARNGKVLGGRRLLIGDRCFGDNTLGGDAPSSPELTVGDDGDAVDWYAPRSVTYSRRGEIKVPPAVTRSP